MKRVPEDHHEPADVEGNGERVGAAEGVSARRAAPAERLAVPGQRPLEVDVESTAGDVWQHPPHDDAAIGAAHGSDREALHATAADAEAATLQNVGQVVFQIIAGIVVLAAAGMMTWYLVTTKTAPAEVPVDRPPPRVEVWEARVGDHQVTVSGYGTVRATRRLQVLPEVGGRIVEVNPRLLAGGTLRPAEVLVRMDSADFELAHEQAEADVRRAQAGLNRLASRRRAASAEVARAETALQTVEAEAAVARAEFERLNPGESVPPLVGREPQLREAQATLAAAEAALEDVESEREELDAQLAQARSRLRQAQLNLDRTVVRLPERAGTWRVVEAHIDVGQSVSPQQTLATLYDAESLEVPVPLEDRQLRWIEIPGVDPATTAQPAQAGRADALTGSAAVIHARYAGEGRAWAGRVDRTDGQVNPRTRMVDVVVGVVESLSDDGEARLVPGVFVEVEIAGSRIGEVIAIPRRALRQPTARNGPARRDVVHVVRDGRLEFVELEIVRREADLVFVRGLAEGDLVALTRLDTATQGQEVQIAVVENGPGAGRE